MSPQAPSPRPPWPKDFPEIVIHTTVRVRDAHPDYEAAKAGYAEAAVRLAHALMTSTAVEQARRRIGGQNPLIVPVTAIETNGFNAIPDAMAKKLAADLGLGVATGVVQSNVVFHTRSSGFHRLASRAEFDGDIFSGREYFIVDDHVGLGGTIAELRAHVEAGGGTVIGAATLTESRDSHQIALDDETLRALRAKHGDDLERFWRERFGYGLEGLTRPEAGFLLRTPTFERIRNRIAQAEAERGP